MQNYSQAQGATQTELKSGEDEAGSVSEVQVTQTVTGNKSQTMGQLSGGQIFGNATGSVVSGSGNSVTSMAQATAQESTPSPVKTVLFLAANPGATNPIRLDEEVREIQSGLGRSKCRDRFYIEQRWAFSPRDIQRALLDLRPQIVHFSGQGVASETAIQSEGLFFEDNIGQVEFASPDSLKRLFSLFSDDVECVVLNAAFSAAQADAIAQSIPYVVGVKQTMSEQAAIEFTIGFYDGLLAGRSVEVAFQFGCNAIQLQGLPEALIPILKIGRR